MGFVIAVCDVIFAGFYTAIGITVVILYVTEICYRGEVKFRQDLSGVDLVPHFCHIFFGFLGLSESIMMLLMPTILVGWSLASKRV